MISNEKMRDSYYSIGTVSRLTGITVHTLRVWEKRYHAIETERSLNGRRQYKSTDVDRLLSLKYLVDRGCPISSIAKLDESNLKEKLSEFNKKNSTSDILQKKGKSSIAVFGEYLPVKIKKTNHCLDDFVIIFSGSDINSFKADVSRIKPDILVLEFPVVDEHVVNLIMDLQSTTGARHIVVVYSFARSIDIKKINDGISTTIKSPVAIEELFKIISSFKISVPDNEDQNVQIRSEKPVEFTAPARKYSRKTLAHLATISSSIACECPHHLTELVINLSNFEDYSSECVNKSPEDAELHAYLQSTTANCRASMEEALRRVAEAEGLDINSLI